MRISENAPTKTGAPSMVFSRARPRGQWRKAPLVLVAATLALGACHKPSKPGSAAESGAGTAAACRQTPSGLPVPRYVSLKHDPANARGGPGDDYKLLWVYHARGLPLLVVEETQEWRRVRDPDGGLAWVHKRVIDGERTVMRAEGSDLPLRDRPAEDARVTAVLASRAIATLIKCQGGWCKVSADHAAGWALDSALWGAADPDPTGACPRR
jgi:SH3-like domain-containing protein